MDQRSKAERCGSFKGSTTNRVHLLVDLNDAWNRIHHSKGKTQKYILECEFVGEVACTHEGLFGSLANLLVHSHEETQNNL